MRKSPKIGIGLRTPHYHQILAEKPNIDWLEVHSENFFMLAGLALSKLLEIRKYYPISLHGIGLSLGSASGVNKLHLERLKNLIEKIDPFLVSEHLSWNQDNGIYLPDLLPIPYNNESMQIFCDNINVTQNYLQREILIENPSSYIEFSSSSYDEAEFLSEVTRRTGAKILLDINNIFVSCSNHNWDAINYIRSIKKENVHEFHLAGHSIKEINEKAFLRIDTHDNFVCKEVWELYSFACQYIGNCPTLIEWDAEIPELNILLKEAYKILDYCSKEEHQIHA